jgi:MFS family permease
MGLVLGPMLGAPISEARGRKAVYIITFPIALLFNMGAGLSNSVASLFICRFFAGTFGSPALAIGAGTVADVFDLQVSGGPAATFFIMMPFLGPAVGKSFICCPDYADLR